MNNTKTISSLLREATCCIHNNSHGTGWLYKKIDNVGYVITAGHVLSKDDNNVPVEVSVEFSDPNESKSASIILHHYDEEKVDQVVFDCAILKIKNIDRNPLDIKLEKQISGSVEIQGYRETSTLSAEGGTLAKTIDFRSRTNDETYLFKIKDTKINRGFSGAAIYRELSEGVIAIVVSIEGQTNTTAYGLPIYRIDKWLKKSYETQFNDYQAILKSNQSNESTLFAECKRTNKGWLEWYDAFKKIKDSYDKTKELYDIQFPNDQLDKIPEPDRSSFTPEKELIYSAIEELLQLLNAQIEVNRVLTNENHDLIIKNRVLTNNNNRYFYIMIAGGALACIIGLILGFLLKFYFS